MSNAVDPDARPVVTNRAAVALLCCVLPLVGLVGGWTVAALFQASDFDPVVESVSALAASIASGQAGCTATTTTPQLSQAVQQQIASGGSVGGGDQTMGGTTTNNLM